MRNFSKAARAALSLLLCLTLISACAIAPMLHGEYGECQDQKIRADLEGNIDFLLLGASHAQHALMPGVIDEELGTRSYNLSGASLTMAGRLALLKKELARNEITDIVVEVSFNTLTKIPAENAYEGDIYMLTRLDTARERFDYLKKQIPFADWDLVYAMLMRFSAAYWQARLTGKPLKSNDPADKGYRHGESFDMTLVSPVTEDRVDLPLYEPEVEAFREILRLARESGARVTVIAVPVSLVNLRASAGWDEIMETISAICAGEGAPFIDFNLLRDREALFPEDVAFHDPIHMSDAGAQAMSRVFSEMYRGELPPERFFSSYRELLNLPPEA